MPRRSMAWCRGSAQIGHRDDGCSGSVFVYSAVSRLWLAVVRRTEMLERRARELTTQKFHTLDKWDIDHPNYDRLFMVRCTTQGRELTVATVGC